MSTEKTQTDTLVRVLSAAADLLESGDATAPADGLPASSQAAAALRDLERRAVRLARALGRPQALGLFGPSQAGKSFLVGALLSHEVGSLEVRGRTTTLDFLKEVNPAKGVESTGVVTRFSSREPALVQGEFACELLSLEGLLASLATGFLSECTAPPPNPERVQRALTRARAEGGAPLPAALLRAFSYAFADLCKKYGERHPYLAELMRAAELAAPQGIVTVPGFLVVCSLLWGGPDYAPDLDRLFGVLFAGLQRVGFAERLELSADDVRARSTGHSLVDAACLNAIGTPVAAVTAYLPSGQPVSLAPSVLAALIAELCLPLRTSATGSLLDRCDLLDFPGGRALKGMSGFKPEELATGKFDAAIEVFKRGKLTSLFEDYARHREITALLLCSPGPTKPEAVQLQGQVEDWLKLRYGASTPKTAAELDEPSLFLALTKFDMSLGSLRSDNAKDRWESRVQEACVDFWAKNADSWLLNWGQRQKSFDNLYWIRNPFADQMQTLQPGTSDFEAVKEGYFAARAVAKHIRHPESKWEAVEGIEAVTNLPRSGVPLLAEALRAKLQRDIKAEELLGELESLRNEARESMAALVPSQDIEEERTRRMGLARSLADALQKAVENDASGLPFGRFVQAIVLPYDAVLGETKRALAAILPLSIKGSDKVKRLLFHMLKWWQTEASTRSRQSISLPQAAVDLYLREILTSKAIVPLLGNRLLPAFSKNSVDADQIARILHVTTSDCMLHLHRPSPRRTPEGPLRLSFSEASAVDAGGGPVSIDWSLDFEGDAPTPPAVCFAGKARLDHLVEFLPALYTDSMGAHAAGPRDPLTVKLAGLQRELP